MLPMVGNLSVGGLRRALKPLMRDWADVLERITCHARNSQAGGACSVQEGVLVPQAAEQDHLASLAIREVALYKSRHRRMSVSNWQRACANVEACCLYVVRLMRVCLLIAL